MVSDGYAAAFEISTLAFTNVKPLSARGTLQNRLQLDEKDERILGVLMEDGRASLRQIAQRTSMTTPTVSAHFARMKKGGLIKRFVPILSPDSLQHGVSAMVTLQVEASTVERVTRALARLPEVGHVYTMTGQTVALKLALDEVQELEPFLRTSILNKPGVSLISSQIITSVVKEEPPSSPPRLLSMNLSCDYCQGEVRSRRPYTISVGSSHYYFCCKTCRREYLEKYGTRLAKLKPA